MKVLVALAALASLTLLAPSEASARGFGRGGGFHGGGFHHGGGWRGGGYGWRGPAIGLGVGLGLAGAYGAYGNGYGYPASYAYYGGGNCYIARQRVWTIYGWRVRPVRVCSY